MTIEQVVDIPANHRLVIDVPREIPAGRANVILMFPATPEAAGTERKRYLTMNKEERAVEDAREMELFKLHVEELNREAEDVLKDQADIFDFIPPYEQDI